MNAVDEQTNDLHRANPQSNYRLRVVESLDEFSALRDAWNRLTDESHGSSLFMSWAWLAAAWKSLPPDAFPMIVLVEHAGEIAAAAPLARRRTRYYGVKVQELTFLGDEISDRQDFLCRPSETAALEHLWRFIGSSVPHTDLVRLEQFPENSAGLAAGRATLYRLEIEPASKLAAMKIDQTWDSYFKSLPSALRRDLRQSERRLQEFGSWRIRHIDGPAILVELPRIRDIEISSYKSDAGKAFLASPENYRFLSSFIKIAPLKTAVLTLLEIEDAIAAYALGFVHRGIYHGYNTSFDEHFKRAAPGKYVISQSIRFAFDARLTAMDFLRGGTQLKERFGGHESVNFRAVHFYPGLKGRLLRAGIFYVRPLIKRLLKLARKSKSALPTNGRRH